MAKRISGITIEIGGDTSNLQKSLKGVDTQLKKTQDKLKDVNKLLKLDPKNTELLTQKQKALEDAISLTKDRLSQLKDAQSNVAKGTAEWDAIQREIIDTEQNLTGLQKEYKNFGSVAKQQLKAVGEDLKKAGRKVSDFGKKLSGLSGTAAAIGGGLLKLGYDAVSSADELNTLAKQTGFTTDEIQKMKYAADLVDVSFEDIAGALKKFKSKVDPANNSLAALGVNTLDANGNLRDATEVFYDAIAALSEIENETERDQTAMELFGKSSDSLAGIIDDGGAALAEYGQQAEDLGLILDQDTLNSLNETNDTIAEMKVQIAGIMTQIGTKVVPVLAPLLEKAGELITNVADKLSGLDEETMSTILTVVGATAALAPVITSVGALMTGVGSLVAILGGPLTLAIAGVIAVGALLAANWDKIKESAVAVKDNLKSTWEQMKTDFSSIVDNIKTKIDGLKQKFVDLKDKVKEIWNTIKGILTGEIKLPKIPLPHFKLIPEGWKIKDLVQGEIPSLSIDWYRKAYDNPVIFASPTVVNTPSGYKGFGDGHGAEIVMGLDKLREMVGGMGNNVTVQVVLEGDARGLFKVVNRTNAVRTRATNYNALAAGV